MKFIFVIKNELIKYKTIVEYLFSAQYGYFKDKNWKEVERLLRLRDLFATAIVCFNILMKVPKPYTQSGTKAYRWDWKDAMRKEYSNDLVEMFDNFFLQKNFYSFEHIVDKLKGAKK